MTDQRIGYRADARHWLAIAKEIDEQHPKSLPPEWRSRLDAALAELNEVVWSGGVAALYKPVKQKEKDKKSDESEPRPKKREKTEDEE